VRQRERERERERKRKREEVRTAKANSYIRGDNLKQEYLPTGMNRFTIWMYLTLGKL